MNERMIVPRKATPPYGLPVTSAPLAIFAKDVDGMRRVGMILWARRHDKEDPRDIAKRVNRQLGAGVIPSRKSELRDLQCEGIDLVLLVAGLIWPGLDAWCEGNTGEQTKADFWWGRWGEYPGAAVLRDGVLHLIYMDQDADRMSTCDWAKWGLTNWRGPVLHHGIQLITGDTNQDSVLVHSLRRQGARGGCILWPTRGGIDIRPYRAVFAGTDVLMSPLTEAFRVAATQGSPLHLKHQLERMDVFWTWLKAMEVPAENRAPVPEQLFLEVSLPAKLKRGNGGAVKGQEPQAGMKPLLDDAFTAVDELKTDAEKEFGEKIGPDTDPARLSQFKRSAEQELMKATMAHNRRNADRWRAILAEVESFMPPESEKEVEPPGGRPLVAP